MLHTELLLAYGETMMHMCAIIGKGLIQSTLTNTCTCMHAFAMRYLPVTVTLYSMTTTGGSGRGCGNVHCTDSTDPLISGAVTVRTDVNLLPSTDTIWPFDNCPQISVSIATVWRSLISPLAQSNTELSPLHTVLPNPPLVSVTVQVKLTDPPGQTSTPATVSDIMWQHFDHKGNTIIMCCTQMENLHNLQALTDRPTSNSVGDSMVPLKGDHQRMHVQYSWETWCPDHNWANQMHRIRILQTRGVPTDSFQVCRTRGRGGSANPHAYDQNKESVA